MGDAICTPRWPYPKGAAMPMAAVIYIHGGGWIGGTQKQAPIEMLARAGYFAASIEYRLSNEAKWPAQIEDCKLGVRWLRANAAQYGSTRTGSRPGAIARAGIL